MDFETPNIPVHVNDHPSNNIRHPEPGPRAKPFEVQLEGSAGTGDTLKSNDLSLTVSKTLGRW